VPNTGYHFTGWTGTVQSAANPFSVTMGRPYTEVALFAINLTTNGVPEEWLIRFGWTNDFRTAALLDQDGDGMPTWAEFYAGTCPTSCTDCLRVTPLRGAVVDGQANLVLCWSTVSGRLYAVTSTTNLMTSWTTNAAAIRGNGSVRCYTNGAITVRQRFYRVGVGSEP
jgi:hypothetical protein